LGKAHPTLPKRETSSLVPRRIRRCGKVTKRKVSCIEGEDVLRCRKRGGEKTKLLRIARTEGCFVTIRNRLHVCHVRVEYRGKNKSDLLLGEKRREVPLSAAGEEKKKIQRD